MFKAMTIAYLLINIERRCQMFNLRNSMKMIKQAILLVFSF